MSTLVPVWATFTTPAISPQAAHRQHARADDSDLHANFQLAELLTERGDLDGLRVRAYAGHGDAARMAAVSRPGFVGGYDALASGVIGV
jgi:hypothetical protein